MSSRFTPQGTRPLALLLAAAALVAPARVAAQGADRAVATVRLQDGVMIIGAGRDGTVSISLGDPHEAHKARREQVRFRERFDPGEVDAWVDALESRMRVLDTLQVKDGQPREMTSTLTLGHPTGAALSATWYAPAVGSLSFDGRPCPSTGGQSVPISRAAVATLLPALRMAASAARSAAPASRRLADQRVYESHEVSCPAFPESGNPRPRHPDAADGQGAPGANELLATLVVGIDGRAESGSVRVMDGSDPRFVASFLATLPEWQFTPASRAGVLVRQRTHVVVPFGGPVVADTTVAPIRFGTSHDGRVVIGPMVREWRFGGAPEQRLHAFDVITPEMAESWADSAVAAMRMADTAIQRCDPNWGCIARLGWLRGFSLYVGSYRAGDQMVRITGLGDCDDWQGQGFPITEAQVEASAANARAAAARARRTAARGGDDASRVHYAHEVACPVDWIVRTHSTPRVTEPTPWPVGVRVLARFVVDTSGRAEPASVRTLASSDIGDVRDSVRSILHGVRFIPAKLGGRYVRQLAHFELFLDSATLRPGLAATMAEPRTDTDRGALAGMVANSRTGEAVAGVTVRLVRTDGPAALVLPLTAVSDGAGRFAFGLLPPGEYALVLARRGARIDRRWVRVAAGRVSSVHVDTSEAAPTW